MPRHVSYVILAIVSIHGHAIVILTPPAAVRVDRMPSAQQTLLVNCSQLRESKMHQSIRDCRHPSLDIAMDANPPSAAAILAHRTLPTDQGDACRRSATMKITRRLKKSPPPYAPSTSRHPCSASCMAREDQELGAAVFHSALHRHWAASRR